MGLGTRRSCLTTPLFILPYLFYELSHLPAPHIFPVPVSVLDPPVRGSEADNFADERADVTSIYR